MSMDAQTVLSPCTKNANEKERWTELKKQEELFLILVFGYFVGGFFLCGKLNAVKCRLGGEYNIAPHQC